MERENVIAGKSFAFALRIVRLYSWLRKERQEYTLARQVLRSGTSVGANVEEAIGGFSKDFTAKMGIAYKEIRETLYRLRLLKATDYIDMAQFQSLHADAEEIKKLLIAILKTSRKD
jgi:four helix bundle protein